AAYARQQPALRERGQRGDAQPVLGAGRRRGRSALALFQLRQRWLHRAQQRGTGGVQHHAAATPVKQRKAQLLLQQLDLLADGAVRQVQFLGRGAQVGQRRHGAEGGQGVERQAAHFW